MNIDEIHEQIDSLLGYECVIVKLETYNEMVDELVKMKAQAEEFEHFKTERREMIELMVRKGLVTPDEYLAIVNEVLRNSP